MVHMYKLYSGIRLAFLFALLFVLAACSRGGATAATASAPAAPAAGQAGNGPGGQFGGTLFESAYLSTSYESALPTTLQLPLGTLELEGSDMALTPEQAIKLLPLWQAVQAGSITNAAERNALYKAIEQAMDEAQLQQIATMQLTFADMTEWATANGIALPQGVGSLAKVVQAL
ncbi:MAG: hypothetical protein R2932_34820 [Caldilineaceae bacterium]